MPRRSILPLAAVLLALAPSAAAAAGPGTTFLVGGLDLPPGGIAGGLSGYADSAPDRSAVSDDGRFVAFVSDADTLDTAAHPDVTNVFRKDRLTGEVVLVSRADGAAGATFPFTSSMPSISDDGTRVAFKTRAPLDPADADDTRDVYVRDVLTGTTTLASVGTTAGVGGFDLSGDGRFVVFATEDAVIPASDANGTWDVYRRSLAASTTVLVSDDAAAGVRAGDRASIDPSASDDGVWVAFASRATDVASPYTAGSGYQVFARDMTAGRTYVVSARDGASTTGSDGESLEADIAGAPPTARTDRVVIAYTSYATDLDRTDDGVAAASIFRRVLNVGNSELVSRADGAAGPNADSRAHTPTISDDGSAVVFSSDARNLGAGADYYGVYARQVDTSRTRLVSAANSYAVQGALAGGGGFAAWYEVGATADSDPEVGSVFGRVYDGSSATVGPVQLVSRPPGSGPFLIPAIEVEPATSASRTISADGRYVVFTAYTTSRLPGGSASGPTLVYRRDTLTGAVELISRANGANGAPAPGFSSAATISADGNRVAFVTGSALDPAHGDGSSQAYVRDVAAGTTVLASRADGPGGALPDRGVASGSTEISADGNRVAFATSATNLGVPGSLQHIWLRDLAAGTTQLVDRAGGAGGAPGDRAAKLPSPSADGRFVAFESSAANLDPDDANGVADVYVRDTVAGTTTLASRRGGLAGAAATAPSHDASLSADGRVVAFLAQDETLAPEAGSWGGRRQVVARTLATGVNVLVSRAPGGTPANADAEPPSVDGDGSVVAFSSGATNLLPPLGGDSRHAVYARSTATGALSGPPAFGLLDASPQQGAFTPSISDDGNCMTFAARGHNAATGTAGDFLTPYVYVVAGECPGVPAARPTPRRSAPRRAARPTLTNASLLRKRFRVGRRATPKVATARAAARRRGARRRPAPVGTAFRFTLDTQARVTILIERPAQGRLVGRFCRRPAPRLRRNLRCVRFVRVGTLTRTGVRAGRASVAFSGRVGRKALRPGKHRARLRAGNGSGVSRWVRLGFRVVR